MMMQNLTIILYVSFMVTVVSGYKNKSAGYMLYKYLMVDQEYSPIVRPAVNNSNPTTVNVGLKLVSMVNFDEVSETLTITAKLKLVWTDDYLTWDPKDYNGLQSISIPQYNIWKPDVALENSVESYHDLGGKNMYVAVRYDGRVQWKPINVFRSSCSADVTKYPVDVQTCCLDFEAWSHSKGSVRITNSSDHVFLHAEYDGHPQWQITRSSAETRFIGDNYYVIFCLLLKRQSQYLLLNIILPISLLSLLNSCVFFLPASCGEKASFSVTVFLSLSVFLTIVSEQLPHTSDNVSIFNLYVFIQLIISTIVTMTALIQIRLFHRDDTRKVPDWLRKFFKATGLLGKQKSDRTRKDAEKSETNNIDQTSKETKENHPENDQNVTWKRIAECMDPLLFVGYSCLNIVCTLVLAFCIVNA
jgi:hypothetical protein